MMTPDERYDWTVSRRWLQVSDKNEEANGIEVQLSAAPQRWAILKGHVNLTLKSWSDF